MPFPTKLQLGKKIDREMLESAGFKIGDYASQILKKVTFKKKEVELKILTVKELGFEPYATLSQIYAKAKEMGYELCPAEVGPSLRLAYKNQPNNEWLRIAMEPIAGSGGDLFVFDVGHGGDERWLSTFCFLPQYAWDLVGQFVFVLPRKVSKSLEPLALGSLDGKIIQIQGIDYILTKK